MADVSVKPQREKKKRRKLSSSKEGQKPQKMQRIVSIDKEPEEVEAGKNIEQREWDMKLEERPWRNLQLILAIQNKEIELQKKVELAFNFVEFREKGGSGVDEESETVKISRLIVFLNDWIQSLLISPEKKVKSDGNLEACLDFRCWQIFKFCLEESLKLHVSLNFSRNLLRAISYIARNALSLLSDTFLSSKDSYFIGEGFELYGSVLHCVSMLFSSQSGLSNENLDLWISAADAVLQLVHKTFAENLEEGCIGAFALQLSCLVLKPFAEFLRIHPTRKNGFRDFVDKLLEPLLHLLGTLHNQIDGNHCGSTKNLLQLVEEVLTYGLFHPTHVDGFLSLCTVDKYAGSHDGKVKISKLIIKSYHRHLFDKLENIMSAKKVVVSSGVGQLFHLFVDQVKKQKGASMLVKANESIGRSEGSRCLEDDSLDHMYMDSTQERKLPEKGHRSSNLNAETRKSLLDFFVQILEPFLLEMNVYLQPNLAAAPLFLDVNCTLRSINSLLACFRNEKFYVRTDDISEGACLQFLKMVYDTIVSFASKLLSLYKSDVDSGMQKETVPLLSKELFLAIGYLLDIEYEVLGNDLTSIWRTMLSYVTIDLSFVDALDQHLLVSSILDLGCQLVNLYSALRQVNTCIFSLCKAVRLVIMPHDSDGSSTKSFSSKTNAKSVGVLLSSQKFKLAFHDAIKTIPEGQASECIQQLTADVSESIEWIKSCYSVIDGKDFGSLDIRNPIVVQAELLGVLSEIYILLLDSLIVTSGNSNMLGLSMKELMTTIRPCISSLVGRQPNGVNELVSSFTGKTFDSIIAENSHEDYIISTHWIFVFFFRLYMSSRSLYRQVISLLPPSTSRKMSSAIGDVFTAYAGRDWMEKTDWTDEGYFSWVLTPSPSLTDITHCLSEIYFKDKVGGCCPLIYILHIMALQRLVDLNRHITSLQYLLQHTENLVEVKMHDDAALSLYRKKSRKLRRHISVLEQEAVGLTDFMLGYLSLVANNGLLMPTSNDASCENKYFQVHESDGWDLGVCSINEKSLPCAIWWVICQNVDIWCPHAATKKLKKFLQLLIQASLPCLSSSFSQACKQEIVKSCPLKKVTVHQIAAELLTDSILYEHKFVRRNLASRCCRVFQEIDREQKALSFTGTKFKDCQSLLGLLCWMPKGYLSSKSFLLLANYIINLERLIVASLLERLGALPLQDYCELLQLFVSCRRTLKNIIMSYCEENREASLSSLLSVMIEGSVLVLWLFKSVIGLLEAMPEDCLPECNLMIFSLMDHSSYIFLTISKHQFSQAALFFTNAKKQSTCSVGVEQTIVGKPDACLDYCKESEALRSLLLVAENLKEQAESLLIPLKEMLKNGKFVVKSNVVNMNKLSFVVSCFGGFFWGITMAINRIGEIKGDLKEKFLRRKWEPVSKLNLCINEFADFIGDSLQIFVDDNQLPGSNCEAQSFQELDSSRDSLGEFPPHNMLSAKQLSESESVRICSTAPCIENDLGSTSAHMGRLQNENANCPSNVLEVDLGKHCCLKKHLLLGLLKGDLPETAILLRQLFITYSAILRLNLHANRTSLSRKLVHIFTGISQVLLSELATSFEMPQPFSFVWLDGVVKYLEVLGSHFALSNLALNDNVYAKLMRLHLRVIGKCIALQGKGATLESHERESSTKILHGDTLFSESFCSHGPHCLDEFKARLRMSFKVFIKNASESHLLAAIQSIEKALVGVKEGCSMVYEINTGSAVGGKVSSTVAAGIDCLDLILEYVTGRKHLSVVKGRIQSLIAALFNIILHLQNPFIFYRKSVGNQSVNDPDPGSVILMCVEVLTRICGKPALFQMDSWHIGQSLRIPGSLFQDFCQIGHCEEPAFYCSLFSDNLKNDSLASMKNYVVDRKFSINLFAACCRMLCTVLKHHKSECDQCIAVLENSISVLLHCLETVDSHLMVSKGLFSWEVEEGVKCACFLRRIYEEIRQQKDIFSRHCFKFLSSYIWVYSGYGPLSAGIRREIDEALRPGIYALIDACSAKDLQYLHTVFGEGPCRKTLASLQHDYKLNFRYEGKV